MGLTSRRRYRWARGKIVDYWDEVFSPDAVEADRAALDDQSAFIASLGSSRSPRMLDVLATIQADQDAIIRASSHGALVVDGGPGTGKTVVALHRTAYLLYSDPRLRHEHGGVLFVGPHQPYLNYVADVLPNLGEEGVLTCTLRDLVDQGAQALVETDPEVTRLKSGADLVGAIEQAVAFHEQPPTARLTVETPWSELELTAGDWALAFQAAEPGVPHNEARDLILEELVRILVDKSQADVSTEVLERSLLRNRGLRETLYRAWPLVAAPDLVADLWSVPAYLRLCAPWLSPADVRRLQRADPHRWTTADLPLLDAARHRLGDPAMAGLARRRAAAAERHESSMNLVVDNLIETDQSDMGVMGMLRGADLRQALADNDELPRLEPDALAGPFAHVVVDEAQELTDAEWQMVRLRCPSGSVTVVGDRAQARNGFTETWHQRLQRVGVDRVEVARLTINYRTPEEVMDEAAPVIRAAIPDANVPTSVRSTGIGVRYGSVSERDALLDSWLASDPDGIACVIGDVGYPASDRVHSSTPESVKGLEFDLVVLVNPQLWGDDLRGAVDRYVAMTRATQQLVILSG